MPRVAVVGSVNRDVIIGVQRLPSEGETVLATSRREGLGGKGANQAVAVARAGVPVMLVGAVGDDDAGRWLRTTLEAAAVDVSALETCQAVASGTAFVFVDAQGQNQIVVDAGANAHVVLDEQSLDVVRATDVLVVQCDVPEQVVAAAVAAAEAAGTQIVVNLAPYRSAPRVVAKADPLVVNEHEAGELTGRDVTGAADVLAMRDDILVLCRSAVVTLGSDGAVLLTRDGGVAVPSPTPRRVVDTTGAGDAFVGVLAAGLTLEECVRAAAAAGSLSVETEGAGSGYPQFDLAGDRD